MMIYGKTFIFGIKTQYCDLTVTVLLGFPCLQFFHSLTWLFGRRLPILLVVASVIRRI